MQNFRALEAPPPDPRASGGWGLCPQTPRSPLASAGLGLRAQTPQTAPLLRISGYAPGSQYVRITNGEKSSPLHFNQTLRETPPKKCSGVVFAFLGSEHLPQSKE